MRPLIIYIAGYGRSGSTVLDIALGATCDNAVSLGEAVGLPRSSKRKRLGCSCGAAYSECSVWSECLETSQVRKADWAGIARRDWIFPMNASPKRIYSMFWERVLKARLRLGTEGASKGKLGAKDIAIDSSKTIVYTATRPRNLVQCAVADVFVVHVKRPLGGIILSRRRGRNVELANQMEGSNLSAREKVFGLIWYLVVPLHALLADFFASKLAKSDEFLGYVEVHFDKLVQNPEAVAIEIWERVSSATGRDLSIRSPVCNRVGVDHVVEGNRLLRNKKGVQIKPNNALPKNQSNKE